MSSSALGFLLFVDDTSLLYNHKDSIRKKVIDVILLNQKSMRTMEYRTPFVKETNNKICFLLCQY